MAAKRKKTPAAAHERVIRRLKKEIGDIDEMFYSGAGGLENERFMLERKRDDIVRSVVLQLHTATEDVLDSLLRNRLLGIKADGWIPYVASHRATVRDLADVLTGGRAIGFEQKLKLLRGLGVLRKDTCKKLADLNQLRNKCSHHWLLNGYVRRGIKPQETKRPLLQFNGKSLYNVPVLREFAGVYGQLYSLLFVRTL